MFGGIRHLVSSLRGGGAEAPAPRARAPADCATCDPELLKTCTGAEPGSVKPFKYHVLVHLPPGVCDDPTPGAWWPRGVESVEPLGLLARAIKATKVKGINLLAYEGVRKLPSPGAGKAHVLFFPPCEDMGTVALDQLNDAVVAAVERREAGPPYSPAPLPAAERSRLYLLVCAHGARDSRCGVLGGQLSEVLDALLDSKGLSDEVTVLRVSHVGGHVQAGNVIAWGAGWPVDGDWFGGVHADNAKEWLDAVLAATTRAVDDDALRTYWRGRYDLSKDEQLEAFKAKAADIEDLAGAA